VQEIKKLLRHKWAHVKGDMEAGMQALRATVTRCKTMLEHGSAVAAVCRGGAGDDELIVLVREEMKVIHRGCKDALEESKGAHAEYRSLKVALTETEANVKHMVQHCSNEASFVISAESGTEAELERHELMLAAVLRGKARFGRHRRNLQAQLAKQAQAVGMLERAMTAVEGRVALYAPPGARGAHAAQVQEGHLLLGDGGGAAGGAGGSVGADAMSMAAGQIAATSVACVSVHRDVDTVAVGIGSRSMGLGWAQGVRAPRGVLPPRSRQCWGVVEEEQYDDREAAVEDAPELAGSERAGSMEMVLQASAQRKSAGRQLQRPPAAARAAAGASKRTPLAARGATTTTTTIMRSRRRVDPCGDAGWYYSEHSVYSERSGGRYAEVDDDDLWQLLEACDDAELLLRASDNTPGGVVGDKAAHQAPAHRRQVPPVSRDSIKNPCGPRHPAAAAQGPGGGGRALGRGSCGVGGAIGRGEAGSGGTVAESRVLKSIENHGELVLCTALLLLVCSPYLFASTDVAGAGGGSWAVVWPVMSLFKTVSTVEKQQRATAAKVRHMHA